MNEKLQVKTAALVSIVSGFIAFIAGLPPEQMDSLMGALVAVFPLTWRPEISAIAKLLSLASIAWAAYKASHSGPPANPPETKTTTP